jgi:hypothetical protein
MGLGRIGAACAAVLCCIPALGAPVESERSAVRASAALHSRTDGSGTTTFWGDGASYEIAGPGMTVFFLRRGDGAVVAPMIRVAYVGDGWINVRSVRITVGERTFGPYDDLYQQPTRLQVGPALRVEALMVAVDSDDKWRMLEAIAESDGLGRPVIAVFDADAPYGIEVDRATKRATEQLVRGFRAVTR